MKLREIASVLQGELTGDPDIEVQGASGILDAQEGDITFLADRRLVGECARSGASCVIVKHFTPEIGKPQIAVKNPQYAFARLLELFYVTPFRPTGISDLASVSHRAVVGEGASIHPFACVLDGVVIGKGTIIFPGVFIGEDSTIGDGCIIYPNVTIRERVRIGNRVIIHSGSVIGSDGFGYVFEEGRHHKIPQVGGVIIGDDVEIGANVTIDRATTGHTVVGKGSKIDNLVQVGHNVKIGEHSIIVAQVGIAGSTEIGNFVVLGGQVGIADHVKIEDGCMIAARAGVMGDLKKGIYSGEPAMPHRDFMRAISLFAKLPDLNKKINELEEKVRRLEGRHDDRH